MKVMLTKPRVRTMPPYTIGNTNSLSRPTFPQTYVSFLTCCFWHLLTMEQINGELIGGLDILKEELENDPDFLAPYATTPGKGGMAAPDQQVTPEATSA